MKRTLILVTLACLLHATLSAAGERRLHGQILRSDEEKGRVPVEKNIKVIIDEIGATNYTEENGLFDYFLRDRDRPGKEITFRVGLDNHVIHEPMDGQMRIPKDSELDQLLRLLIVKKGSQALKSDARFRKTIDVGTAESRDQVKPNKDEQPVKVTLDLTAAASKLGFTEEDFRQWILEQAAREARRPDLQAQARAAAAQNDFRKAGDLETRAMDKLAETYARAKPLRQQGPLWLAPPATVHLVNNARPPSAEELERLALELVKGYRFAGDAYYNAYQFDDALRSYKRAEQYVLKDDSPELWAKIKLDIGRAATMLGIRTEGQVIERLLAQAVEAYQAALTVYTKEQLPQQWAITQNDLGTVLQEHGIRTGGKASIQLLAQAVEAYQAALTVRTKAQLPQQWATTQTNLGNVLRDQGIRTGGEAGTQLLAQAVEAYRAALTIYTEAQFPQQWATTQTNLGTVLANQGTRTGGEAGTQLLAQAVDAYRAALEIHTQQQLPQDWAMTQTNLGTVLAEQSVRTTGEGGINLLTKAVEAFRAALTVFTKDALPQHWATTQNNLGNALQLQSTHTGGEAGTQLLAQAVDAYRAALTVYTKEQLPQHWAMTQTNLGNVLQLQGTRTSGEAGTQLLAQAVEAYKAALTVRTKEALPQDWAATLNNLGLVLNNQGTRTSGEAGTQLLAQAVEAYREALTVYTKETLPQQWATTQTNLGNVLANQGTRTGGETGTRLLAQAVAAFRAALEIRTKEHLPQDWAQTHSNLAQAALLLEDWLTAANSYRNVLILYPDNNEAYQAASAVYHGKLFAYPSAFELSKQWLERHPTDLSAQANFAESHLATGRYGEAERRLAELLKKPDLNSNSAVGLRIVEIANLLALKKTDNVPQNLQELRTFVSQQPENFHADWSFDGTKHYVETEQIFTRYRTWLTELFEVVKSKDRAALLAALDHLQTSFTP